MSSTVAEIVIALRDVRKHYIMGTEEVHALAGVTFAIHKGEYVAVMGPSGSGKSTLLNILGCLDLPTSGSYHLNDIDVSNLDDNELSGVRNRYLGFVFQSFHLLPRLTAEENVEVPLIYSGMHHAERRERAREMLEKVGLGERMDHRPNELSGGQRQRVAVARALVNGPALILADEPTGNLDSRTGRQILALFDELHAEGNTLVLVTHEDEVAERASRVITLRDGVVQRDVLNREKE